MSEAVIDPSDAEELEPSTEGIESAIEAIEQVAAGGGGGDEEEGTKYVGGEDERNRGGGVGTGEAA